MSLAKILTRQLPPVDHRIIGLKQNLFFFDEVSPGSCFFKPRGARIYNKLIEYLRHEYRQRHYDEVITPNIYSNKLWEISGHWDHYKDNMIRFKTGSSDFSLKPMNCPGHCLMFKHSDKTRNYTQLPIRWADFGVLHRNELSGSLLGLSRVRRFQQDDAHIFCTPSQVETEVKGCLDFAKAVYGKFGFTFDVRLSLRPENYLGEEDLWNTAEKSLRLALSGNELAWQEEQFEGAFYGPKIDLIVKDCHQRSQQCATIQLDFQLPQRFELTYKDADNTLQRPVIIHRAILGSMERFIAMLAEHTNGMWPFWMSPLQAMVIPIHNERNAYAELVCKRLRERGFWADCDVDLRTTFKAKVRETLLTRYNLLLVVGDREAESGSVTCRIVGPRDDRSADSKAQVVENLNFPLDKLLSLLDEFEHEQVDRADIELLKLDADHRLQ